MGFNQVIYNNKNHICFFAMVLFVLICTLKMADFCLSGGILSPDMCLYSITALKYAGIDYYNIVNPNEIFYTPVISFLTSLLFRIGLVDKAAIIIVTSIFCFFGFVGVYYLLKIRFNSLLSLLGVIIYGSTSVVIFNLSKGLIDIPALSVSIWALYYVILAIDKNPKYYLIVFPLLVIGFFVKYTAVLTIPVVCLYYMINKDVLSLVDNLIYDRDIFRKKLKKYFSSDEFKYIFIAIVLSLILAIIICKVLILDFGGSLSFFQQSASTLNVHNFHSKSSIYNPDKSFYIDNFSNFLYQKQELGLILANILYVILGVGLLLNFIILIKNYKFIQSKKIGFKKKYFEGFLIFLFVILSILSFYGFKVLSNHMFSNIFMFFAIYTLYLILSRFSLNEKKLRINFLFLSFFVFNFIFVSVYPMKTFRYALALLPPFVYVVILSLNSIFDFLTNRFDKEKVVDNKIDKNKSYSMLSNVIVIALIFLFVISTFSFILPMEYNRSNDVYQEVLYCGFSNDLDDACNYIIETDSDYHSKTFASFTHSSRMIRFNLNVNVTIIDNKDPQLTTFNDTDYLILYEDLEFENYNKIADFKDFHVYYHK